jgi:hypothetical protein
MGPLLIFFCAGFLGQRQAKSGRFFNATSGLSPTEQYRLEAVPSLCASNAAWALGNFDSVKQVLKAEIDRIPDEDAVTKARALVRFAIIDMNPEGQAAIFSQACALDASICDHLKEAAEREVSARFAAPGNQLPLFFIPNHPPVGL